jgi:hypothetical protein
MRRREFIALLVARAQVEKKYTVGILSAGGENTVLLDIRYDFTG